MESEFTSGLSIAPTDVGLDAILVAGAQEVIALIAVVVPCDGFGQHGEPAIFFDKPFKITTSRIPRLIIYISTIVKRRECHST